MKNIVSQGNPKHHKKTIQTMRKITVIPVDMAAALSVLGQSTHINASEHIRRAIQHYLHSR